MSQATAGEAAAAAYDEASEAVVAAAAKRNAEKAGGKKLRDTLTFMSGPRDCVGQVGVQKPVSAAFGGGGVKSVLLISFWEIKDPSLLVFDRSPFHHYPFEAYQVTKKKKCGGKTFCPRTPVVEYAFVLCRAALHNGGPAHKFTTSLPSQPAHGQPSACHGQPF